MPDVPSSNILSTILRHDRKITTYKIALVRAINDVALAYPNLGAKGLRIAIPLRALAEFWIPYYWPFASTDRVILQGQRRRRKGTDSYTQDIAFRDELVALREEWAKCLGGIEPLPSDGYVLMEEMRIPRRQRLYPTTLRRAYDRTVKSIIRRIRLPIRYAGEGQWTVFARPTRYKRIRSHVRPIPGTHREDLCVLIDSGLWQMFRDLSLWIEALCIHQWALITPDFNSDVPNDVTRGETYQLLTDRPDNRRPLTWERNQIDILMMEGETFHCPWTEKCISQGISYDIDHLFPFSVYPINELWNLVPTDRQFNQHTKRDRVPSVRRLKAAEPILTQTYRSYDKQRELAAALQEDVRLRFAELDSCQTDFEETVAHAATSLLDEMANYRNLSRF